jgi:hypothetical protein
LSADARRESVKVSVANPGAVHRRAPVLPLKRAATAANLEQTDGLRTLPFIIERDFKPYPRDIYVNYLGPSLISAIAQKGGERYAFRSRKEVMRIGA